MQYIISLLEGIITFISPCLLPMLPIYVSYFAGGGKRDTKKTLICAGGFVLGFTIVFVCLGALAGTVGSFIKEYEAIVNVILGIIVIVFGLNFLGIIRLNMFKGNNINFDTSNLGFFSSVLFGVIFSIGWTPCVGAFLGSALMLASSRGHVVEGIGMLLCYSIGLGIPFIISAILIDRLKTTFNFIKKNYKIINRISGGFLILMGVLMATGLLGRFLNLLG